MRGWVRRAATPESGQAERRRTPIADLCRKLRHRKRPWSARTVFRSRAHDHEPHGCRATRGNAHRLLRRALDLALARKILHADNVIARWNVAGREDADVALDRAVDPLRAR